MFTERCRYCRSLGFKDTDDVVLVGSGFIRPFARRHSSYSVNKRFSDYAHVAEL